MSAGINPRSTLETVSQSFGEDLDPCDLAEIQGQGGLSPELRLQAEILLQAMNDLRPRSRPLVCKYQRLRYLRERDAAVAWIESSDPHPFSFTSICHNLGLTPEVIRGHLLEVCRGERQAPSKCKTRTRTFYHAEIAMAVPVAGTKQIKYRSSRRAAA